MSNFILYGSQRFTNEASNSKTLVHFNYNSETGYVPLLKLLSAKAQGSEDFFLSNHPDYYRDKTIKPYLNINAVHDMLVYNRNARIYDAGLNTLVLSMLSLLGLNARKEVAVGSLRYNSRNVGGIVINPVDIFALAVVKMKDVNSINFDGYETYIDLDKIKILMSKEKFVSPAYMTEHNRKAVRTHVIRAIRELDIELETVTDEEMKGYYTLPYTIKTNSFTEIIEHDRKVKERVALKLNENLVIS